MEKQDKSTEHKTFVGLLMPNQTRIQAFILTLVPNINDAEDIYQETVSLMWDKIDTFEEGTDFVAWAVTIAKYKILEFRSKYVRSKVQFTDQTHTLLESVATSQVSAVNDRLDALKNCLQKLPEKERDLLKMRYELDLSFRKMSQRIGKTSPAIHRTMSIILSKLTLCIRQSLRQEGIV